MNQPAPRVERRPRLPPPPVKTGGGRSNVYPFQAPRPVLGNSLFARFVKRLADLIFVVVFVALFWWLMIAVAIGVKLASPGPLVFGHTRMGRMGRRFRCYKYRSMVTNASEVLEDLLANDELVRQEWESNFKLKADPRITPFGAFIRRTSLDELPQIWNILVGDMSVVGPRPVTRKEIELYYGASRRHYFSMRPGLTGPWQVNGRSNTTYEERVAMDRDYVENWSVLGDLKIIVQTIAVVVAPKGAY